MLRGRRWWKTFGNGELDIPAVAETEGVVPAHIARVVKVRVCLAGGHRRDLEGSV